MIEKAEGDPKSPQIRTLIADDEQLSRCGIRRLLECEPSIEIVGEATGGAEAAELIRKLNPDLAFMEVQMEGCDGFETLQRVGSSLAPVVVFVSRRKDFAQRAFEVNAADHLVKPYQDSRFKAALERALERILLRRNLDKDHRLKQLLKNPWDGITDRIFLRSGGEIICAKTVEIDWLEAEGDYVKVHTARRTYLIRATMSFFDVRLDPKQFIRIHRSTIINVDRLWKLCPSIEGEYAVVLQDGTKLRLSRRYQSRMRTFVGRIRSSKDRSIIGPIS